MGARRRTGLRRRRVKLSRMKHTPARLLIAPVILAALLLTACTDALRTTAKALDDTRSGVQTLQTLVIEAQAQGIMTEADAGAVLSVCRRIDSAGLQVAQLTQNYTALPAGSQSVTELLTPLVIAVQGSITSGAVVNIKDASVKTKVLATLAIVQTALQTAQAALKGK